MFKVGDLAFYPNQGIGKIEKIIKQQVAERTVRFFQLRILDRDITVQVPIDRAESLGLRAILPENDIPKIFKILREKSSIGSYRTWNKRFREYTQKLRTGSPFEIAEVLRDLMQLATGKELSFGERKMLEQAKSLLIKELSFALESDESDLVQQVSEIVQGQRQRLRRSAAS